MAENFTPKSPRPTRAQINAVFGADPDFARKVERLFEDLIKAAEAANANARLIESLQNARPANPPALGSLAKRVEELSMRIDEIDRRARDVDSLRKRIAELEFLLIGA